ncbi:amphoterin-induced protein 3 [Clupea harengus]|uniref:Amphoterin-induced protein 3 n=1 Tax=Clupea harengus TaxID=7950 RepID=A0A6P8FFG8_CLUHA|nr:amphoterin-induced protein 3 [Clupea harengus]XP_031424400.1 amphoterin-induced protein 3 [Clupea harengus]
MLWAWGVVLTLLLGSVPLPLAGGSCPAECLCASDILSCSSISLKQLPATLPSTAATLDFNHNQLSQLEEGSFAGLPRLDSLQLAHNRLVALARGTFRNASSLRHLDLSSNLLRVVEQHYFQELVGMEELLLFNNRITQVESLAAGLSSNLRKAYLSHNLLTDFPFFSIQEHSHPFLSTLDLSSNRMTRLPVEDIWALPPAVQSGLFLHNNTLICECSMYGLFLHWEQRGFASAREYHRDHTCLLYGERRASVRFFQHRRFFENCTLHMPQVGERDGGSLLAYVGDSITLECQTSLQGGQHTRYFWVSPHQEYIAPPGNTQGSLHMHANGSLELVSAQVKDSGVYWCMALNRRRNETREVNVTVVPRHVEYEPFNTGFTTLLGCVVTLVLVLMYLYLTPCHCWCRKQPPAPTTTTPSPANECSAAQSSILTPSTPPATTEGPGRRVSNIKHVVFREPVREVQNGRLLHIKPQVRHDASEPVTSVFSDTLIIR